MMQAMIQLQSIVPQRKNGKIFFSVNKYIYEIDIDDSGNKMSMNCGVNQSKPGRRCVRAFSDVRETGPEFGTVWG